MGGGGLGPDPVFGRASTILRSDLISLILGIDSPSKSNRETVLMTTVSFTKPEALRDSSGP